MTRGESRKAKKKENIFTSFRNRIFELKMCITFFVICRGKPLPYVMIIMISVLGRDKIDDYYI